jgi:hypothetical protein
MKEERGNWGSGSIFRQKGSRFWWISYYRDGKHFRESSKSTGQTMPKVFFGSVSAKWKRAHSFLRRIGA